jgi:putative SOS response-associated peptidase YedK
MCGRYVLKRQDLDALLTRLGVRQGPDFADRYNIAPTSLVPAIRTAAGGVRAAAAIQWGLVPRWARDTSGGGRLANARADGVAAKPSFREAFRHRRCIVPASGFYEWQTVGRLKFPWYFSRPDGAPLALAGIWEAWHSAAGPALETFSLITTEPNDVVRPLHDRMPVILTGEALDRWLDPSIHEPERLQPLLVPLPSALLRAQPVSTRVNRVGQEGPECLAPAQAPATQPAPAGPDQLGLDLG